MLGVQIWKIGSHFSDSTLPGHSKSVNCLEFYTRDDVHYLITGSDDCTAKVCMLVSLSTQLANAVSTHMGMLMIHPY
jgi:WD40 repeat protein